jgi:hypothetical protein
MPSSRGLPTLRGSRMKTIGPLPSGSKVWAWARIPGLSSRRKRTRESKPRTESRKPVSIQLTQGLEGRGPRYPPFFSPLHQRQQRRFSLISYVFLIGNQTFVGMSDVWLLIFPRREGECARDYAVF